MRKIFILLCFFVLLMAAPVHICTDHLHAVEDAITKTDADITNDEDIEKEILEDLDSAFSDIRNSICKADFVQTADMIDKLREKLLRLRQRKAERVREFQRIVNALPPHIQHRLLFKNKLENRMRINPDYISVADVPAIPVFEGMPNLAPIITKIADGYVNELDDVAGDQTLIAFQQKYTQLKRQSSVAFLKSKKVLEAIEAVFASIRVGRLGYTSAQPVYKKLRTILTKTSDEEKKLIENIGKLRVNIFNRKKNLLKKLLASGRIVQKDVVNSRIDYLKKMATATQANSKMENEQRIKSLLEGIDNQWKSLQELKLKESVDTSLPLGPERKTKEEPMDEPPMQEGERE
ncbi:hypothetical protein EIN_407990 [Entamoeba invadens IP1]|uniref:DNA double-strand break repair Rad50 ATPase n=1 Tax=Entamoeba invadens IP1 TaxID=370355 RepID=A0A0A1TZD9_ENTIV|nr:hypothetical protein EIN_407990 [Entamoeba invadens IP1]ELP85570.1 hypothetical protein EIN_407990 [Entamoeba invadens IP1]|eukprot:XP_004184916.1 hypothetical protein EIN_407990 [Entamoeba invadens IP1]